MNCNQCSYTHRTTFVYCPMCGAERVIVRFSVPGFALLGDEFNIVAHTGDQTSLFLNSIEYAGKEIKRFEHPYIIEDGTMIPITIKQRPRIRNNDLTLRFDDFPDRKFKIQVIEPKEIVFKVQKIYDFRPFGGKKDARPILSLSKYDVFTLEIEGFSFLGESLHLEMEIDDVIHRVRTIGRELIIPSAIYPSDKAMLKLVSGDITLTEQEITLHYNHLPRFEIGNEQEIIETNFNIATPNSAFHEIHLKVQVQSNIKEISDASGSDLQSFQVSSNSRHIEVNKRRRFENPEDLNVKLTFRPGSLTDSDIRELSHRRRYEFSIEILINANKELPFQPIKCFRFALPVLDVIETSPFAVIDFGTTNSCLVNYEGKMVPNQFSHNEHKTRIDFMQFGNRLSEHRCDYPQADSLPSAKVAINFKSLLMQNTEQGRIYKDSFGKFRSLNPLQLTELYLRYATDKLVSFNNRKAQEIVVTFPAMFNKSTKQLYFDIYDKLGYDLDVESSITEPEAIAFYYLNNNPDIRKRARENKELVIAVFDCGGGTTDYAIVQYKYGNFEPITNVMACWGTDKFSGIYLSYVIAKCLEKDTAKKYPKRFEDVFMYDTQESKSFSDDYVYLETIKIELSKALNKANISEYFSKDKFKDQQLDKELKLDTDSPYFDVFFEKQSSGNPDIRTISSQLNQINEVMFEMFKNEQINTPDIDYIILAGNSCRLPVFQSLAEEEFGADKVIFDSDNIKTSVVQGAYIYKSRADDTYFEGLQRSQLTFYRYRSLDEKEIVFPRWLDMSKENLISMEYKSRRSRSINFFQKNIDGDEKPAFFIVLPDNLPKGSIIIELKYHSFKIQCRWLVENHEGTRVISDWEEVFNHE